MIRGAEQNSIGAIEFAIAGAEARLDLIPNGKAARNLLAQIGQVVEVIAGGTPNDKRQ